MSGPNSSISSVDGSLSWEGGVDSIKTPTIQSVQNPNGLARNQLSWLINGTVRDSGITPRAGWNKKYTIADGSLPYQGGWMYKPTSGNPYLVLSIGGNIIKADPDGLAKNLTLSSTVHSVPTLGPWTVTLRNQSFATITGAIHIVPSISSAPAGFPQPGVIFTPTSPQYLGSIGSGFTNFAVPPVGADVVVTVNAPYTGAVGDIIKLTGDFTTTGYTGIVMDGSGNVIGYTGKTVRTWVSQMEVLAFSPAFNTITTDISSNPPFGYRSYFCQGEEFLIIQAGDYETPALIWDGEVLRRSIGINSTTAYPGTPGINELPPAGPMDYYMGRFWYSQRGIFSAGDMVKGASGSLKYEFRDSILNVTENPLCLGGDGFSVPRQEGDITALAHNATQDAALGQGILFAFTAKGAHGLTVPVTRSDWIAADSMNQPKLVPVQLANGTASDRSVVPINGDLFFQSAEPALRSLITATRFFNQWSNPPLSANMDRLLKFTDRSLMGYASGVYFNNRLIETALPIMTPQGCVHQATMALDFMPISSFATNIAGGSTPIWEGMYEGLDVLQYFTGVFDGKERMFAVTVSRTEKTIDLWECTVDDRFDNKDNRIQMIIEFPAWTWGQEFELKEQISAELWIDRLYGETVYILEYRPDGESCWLKWHEWKVCSPRNTCENASPDPCTGLVQVQCYPNVPFGESYVQTMTLPKPPIDCSRKSGRPSNLNYQFQARLTQRGFARIRGFLVHAEKRDRKLYDNMVC